ncbi:MAG: tryptophan halogenase [Gammaproteobacteria bacterium]|nr:MAG: tryptophan halogenase [Gammaproteobacteria bacterium]
MLELTLVESEDIGVVGVGEATIPPVRTYHKLAAVDERAFMRASQATFKLGIAFENWGRPGDRYIHSFGRLGLSTWMADFFQIYLEGRRRGLVEDEVGAYCLEWKAAEAERFATGGEPELNYAYHLDAALYGRHLRGLCEARGVRRIEGKIVEVEQDPDSGFIRALRLEDGRRVEGDFFLDCTGLRGLLIEQTLGTGFEDWSHWLPMDRALAVQTRALRPAPPYTRSIAHAAGWQWWIPLQNRVGNGLVYCSAHLSDEEAADTLMAHIEGETLNTPRLIRFRTGRRRQVWNKNCLAVGLSSGFLEPLESTSIHLIQNAVHRFMRLFPFHGVTPALVERYNRLARQEIEAIRDFIILHYKVTEREDSPFWRDCRHMAVPDTLALRIALFEQNALAFQDGEELFAIDSWIQVMLGQRLAPGGHHLFARMMTDQQLRGALDGLRRKVEARIGALPPHDRFVREYCAAEAAPSPAPTG